MIDIRKLKELVRLMVENDLSELDLQDQEETVKIKRGGAAAPVIHHAPVAFAATPAISVADDASDASDTPAVDESSLLAIESPMVGTFYSSASPEAPPFVSVGSDINEGTVVCLIEAMKVFNEIKAECSGKIEKILVKSGEAVEFGQRLFLVRP